MGAPALKACWAAVASVGVALVGSGCDGCDGPPAELKVGGEHPYVRCTFMDPPEARTLQAGGVALAIEGRGATVEAPDAPLRVAAFAGPAPRRHSLAPFMKDVAAAQPHLVFVVGNLGDTQEDAQRTLTEVASAVEVPVLVMAGGRDDATVLTRALAGLPAAVADRVVDARGLWRVHQGAAAMWLVSGAPGGRYGRTDTACGFGAEDLEHMAEALGDGGGGVLLSWAAPHGFGAPGLAGKDGGSRPLATFAQGRAVSHAAFAWPVPGRGMHFTEGGRGQGMWLPSPPPSEPSGIRSMILMRWGVEGLDRIQRHQ